MNGICKTGFIIGSFALIMAPVNPSVAKSKPSLTTPLASTLGSAPLITLYGSPVAFFQARQWKVIYFWGSVCPWVVACERACFVPLAREYAGRVTFYGVATNAYDLNLPHYELAENVERRHLPYQVVLDLTHRIATTLGAISTPQTFILDPHNQVVFVGMPADPTQHLFDIAATPKVPPRTYLSVALAEAMAGTPITQSTLRSAGCVVAR
jgi:hypothetical protein